MRLTLWAALVAIPGLAMAGPYDGIYKQTANSECGLVGVDGGSIQIENDIFYGVEVECRMTKPVDVVDMDAMLYTMECSGEDQQWTERAMLMTPAKEPTGEKPDGLIMVWNGYAFVYKGCVE